MTYNHERFIKDCLEGFVKQITNFPFQVIVHDDASTETTPAIIKEYSDRYPSIIKPIFQEENQWVGKNTNPLIRHVFPQVNTKYIALCEGDDYWTDPLKLQKQVDFLEANQHISLCYHPVDVLFPDGQIEEDFIVKGIMEKQESNIYDLATLGNYIHTPSVLFRNVVRDFPSEFFDSPIGDFFLYMLLGGHGNFYRLTNNMAVYRHGTGHHSTQDDQERTKRWIKTLSLIKEVIEDKTVKKILELRIENQRFNTLPKQLRGLDNFKDIGKANQLVSYTPYQELIKALIMKIKR